MTDTQSAVGPIIYGIPLALWVAIGAVVFAPIISLAGVILSNRNVRKNLKIQLDHDAEERDRERKMTLRREVYLETAVAMTHVNQVLARAWNPESDINAVASEFADDLSKLAKVHIVGGDATVTAVMNYVNEVGPAYLEFLTKRAAHMIAKQMIERETNPELRAQLQRKLTAAIIESSERSVQLAMQIARLMPDAVIAVRNELTLPLDRELYEQLWEAQFRKIAESWSSARVQIEKLGGL
jgi:transcriptional regulator of NAD metabolism